MLDEAKDLQKRAVEELLALANSNRKREITFRAPTGSGKTRMMADFMNRVLVEHTDVVFLVSTLSKGDLARQNYNSFKECADKGVFPNLNPYLINTDISGEETLFIPTDYNVYVLPRDLYKKNGRLMQGAMTNFLQTITEQFFQYGMKKRIWLIKDECHQATNNLDDLSDTYFEKVFNFSATPNMKRGQVPDVQITDEQAVEAKLIKRLELEEDPAIPVEAAIDKLLEIRGRYNNELRTNPCLIIQISNKDKAQQEWQQKICPAIDKHQELKWMLIVDKDKDCDTNDDVKRRLPVSRWKDYAKTTDSTIDIIIFKMVITEGWDIPRACMLYQVRDTKSKQLNEQVVGRIRRNPRLTDFETLPPEAQKLAMTAWVWGLKPESMTRTREVTLFDAPQSNITGNIRISTTRLASLSEKADFDIVKTVEAKPKPPTDTNIFVLWKKLERCANEVQELCYKYAEKSPQRWWRFMERVDDVSRAYDNYICDYDKSIRKDKDVSFPATSSFLVTDQSQKMEEWVWRRKDGSKGTFAFDSEAERRWADLLRECEPYMAKLKTDDLPNKELFLWGKNFPEHSEIRYQYYAHGLHYSYPDFIMKDKAGHIHVFEVKSVNKSGNQFVDEEQYDDKIRTLEEFYLHCSKVLQSHIFYLPILKGEEWTILRYKNGEKKSISEQDFKDSLADGK